MSTILDAIVVGAGHAGLSASYYLKQSGLNHLVLERGRVGESWLSQRWDSFLMNTADKLNTLPANEQLVSEPDYFSSATSFAAVMKDYVSNHSLPVIEHAKVISVDKKPGSDTFLVDVAANGVCASYCCKSVIIASGGQSEKVGSPFQSRIALEIRQVHSSEYRFPKQLPPGAVLIVGSGQSGCQIAEDLIIAGRQVYLSTSKVPRCPRHYRGKDIIDWLILTGFFNTVPEEIADAAMLHMRTPLLKGTHGGRQTLSLQALAKKGVTLLGRLYEAVGCSVRFQNNVYDNVGFADAFSARVKASIDAFIDQNNLDAPPAEADPEDEVSALPGISDSDFSFNLKSRNINCIIWANGFRAGFDYIKLPVFDASNNIAHRHGIAAIDGLYFLGLHWLRSRKSNLLFGIKEDAEFVTNHIVSMLQNQENGKAIHAVS